MFGRIFGAPIAPAPAPPPKAKMDISAHVAGMTQTTNDLQTKIEAVDAEILKLKQQYRVSNPSQQGQMKLRMQQLLASKKRYEQQRGATYARLGNMEQMSFAQQNAQMNAAQMEAMRQTNQDLGELIAEGPDIDDVQDLQFDINDQLVQQEELNNALSQAFDVGAVDDAAIEAELADLDMGMGVGSMDGYNPAGYNPASGQAAQWGMAGAGAGSYAPTGGMSGGAGYYPSVGLPSAPPAFPVNVPTAPVVQQPPPQRLGIGEEMFGTKQ